MLPKILNLKQILVILSALMVLTSNLSAKEPDCVFSGTVNNVKSKSFECSVDRAGSMPYIIFGVAYGGKNLMIDLNGITNKTGPANFSISVMELDGKKIANSYSASGMQKVQTEPKRPDILGFMGEFTAKDAAGKTIVLKGIFAWKTSIFPKEENLTGTFEVRMGSVSVKSKPGEVKVAPWHKGFRVENMFLVKGGETLTVAFQFPLLQPAVYKDIKTTVMHMIADKKGMSSDFYNEEKVSLTVEKKGTKLVLKFSGTVKAKDKKNPITAVWTQQ